MTVGEGVDKAICSVLVGLGRAAQRVLTLRPAKVEADLRAYLAMTALSHEAALVEAEEQSEVLDPFWSDGGPTEWLAPERNKFTVNCCNAGPGCGCFPEGTTVTFTPNLGGVFPSGQPSDDLPSEADCRAQHPLYRQLQDAVEASAPGSLSGSERSPGVAESPRSPATPGQPQPDRTKPLEWPCGCRTYHVDGEKKARYDGMCSDHIYRCKCCKRVVFPALQFDVACCTLCTPPQGNAFRSGGQTFETGPRPKLTTPPVSPAGTGAQAGTGGSQPKLCPESRADDDHDCECVEATGHSGWHYCAYGCRWLRSDLVEQLKSEAVLTVLDDHQCYYDKSAAMYECTCAEDEGDAQFSFHEGWRRHVTPLILAALKAV